MNSQSILTMKGKSYFLTKPKTKQWSNKNLEEKKKEITLKSISLNRKIKFLQAKIDQLEGMQRDYEENFGKLSNLYSLGVIDEVGNLINNKME